MRRIPISSMLGLTLLFSLLLISGCTGGADQDPEVFDVLTCEAADLIQELTNANNSQTAAIVNLPPDCDYILTSVHNTGSILGVDLNNGLPKIKNAITIYGNLSSIRVQPAAGEEPFGHFFIKPEGDLELYDLSLYDGQRPMGGSVVVKGGSFFASRTRFWGNVSGTSLSDVSPRGGAIFNRNGSVRVIDNSEFTNNTTSDTGTPGYGGAIYSINGSLLVSSTSFHSNLATRHGGAIYSAKIPEDGSGAQVILSDVGIYHNQAGGHGGGIYLANEQVDAVIQHSIIMGNNAAYYGGGIYSRSSKLIIAETSVFYNEAYHGGGIYTKRTGPELDSSLELLNTMVNFNSAAKIGGGLFSENSDLDIVSGGFRENSAESCGGIRHGGDSSLNIELGGLATAAMVPSEFNLTNTGFYENQAIVSYGGAICHVMGKLTIHPNTSYPEPLISRNEAAEFAGALFLASEFDIEGVKIERNVAKRGGGVVVGLPVLDENVPAPQYMDFQSRISNTLFTMNEATEYGGGFWANHGGLVTIEHSTFLNNSAGIAGGGIFQNHGDLNIHNSTFSRNDAAKGGGLYNLGDLTSGPILEIKHSTFAYNTADPPSDPGDPDYDYRSGGGGLNINGTVKIYNSLVVLNTSKDCDLNQGLNYTHQGNVDSDGYCGFSITEPNPMIEVNVSLQGIHALLPGSPLIDILPDCAGLTEDQIYTNRPQGQNGMCDPGAHEFISSEPRSQEPPPPPSEPETDLCTFFDDLEMTVTMLDIPPGTTSQTIFITIPGGVPVLEIEVPGYAGEAQYRAALGSAEDPECTYQGYATRLYCTFDLSPAAFGTTQPLSAWFNDCPEPFFTHPRVSIFEPALLCTADLGETECIEAGGEYKKITDLMSQCICPEDD